MHPPEAIRPAELRTLSTFRLPAQAAELRCIEHPEQLPALPDFDGPDLILGGGSNTIFLDDWPGRILLDRMRGLSFETIDHDRVRVRAAAGESWHGLVRRCLDEGLHGIENLALIPGSVGAAPVQNIGAYGVELDQVFESLRAWDRQARRWVELDREDCAFAYRDSRFKSQEPDRYFITEVRLVLSRRFSPNLSYSSLAEALDRAQTPEPTPRQLVAAILRLRRHRLPDPARLANAGSFFKNPIVESDQAREVLAITPDLPHWDLPDGRVKLAAGAMLERQGFKGLRRGALGVYTNHALVLVNHGGGQGPELRALIDHLIASIRARYGITLEPEPRLIG
ncbi:UDP-N-acetylmuramate dehydrogenase [Wenzhouxiangella marina]|uniref:UDP-N-acetylenolpyruvoylglucosamine reductase n=1 Tax=Wenzhouxiangella marina TaxID=1579979 RepID=A0A0K0XXM3_9GAMM|nr:UDP-N-acetylmuramate dehydrogenase [Wenzhouxiangella marina]AKS42449.1 UDP-N-acetylenolpyruvoylglucosamine reductase [Wenzhouxiangella marina]MBB6085776.1 UDP-N-acetylmuramate dehydrogenase [Wenzhouxiangella marina]